ncbi:hypothetical protein FRC08_011178 [Ceratobasidium sp. 394]|nr:hypothetical protein FRC08_011178 [Ceratobasidium sp. 394]
MPPKSKNAAVAPAKAKPSAKPKEPKPKSTKAAPNKALTTATAPAASNHPAPASPNPDAVSPTAEEVEEVEEVEEGPSHKGGHRGRVPGATNFSDAQKFTMLNTIKELGAIGSNYFELVAERLNEIYNTRRNGDGCRRQYEKLLKEAKEKPTRDPDYPELYRHAMEVSRAITAHAGVVSLRDCREAVKALAARASRANPSGSGDEDEGSGTGGVGDGDDGEAGGEVNNGSGEEWDGEEGGRKGRTMAR